MRRSNWHDGVFFGLHFDLHAGPGDAALGADLSVEHLVRELGKVVPDFVQCDCKGHPGYASYPTEKGTAAPHIVQDSLRIWRDAAKRLGIPLIVHYSGIWDHAALLSHPEWGRRNEEGIAQEPWLPREKGPTGLDADFACPLSAYTTDYMAAQMVEVIDRYDVDGFWVDGENWASAPCYCDTCRDGFARVSGIPSAPVSESEMGWKAWLDYSRANFEEHVRRYAAIVHERKPTCTVCSNWMYTARQPGPVHVPVDYLSGDFDWIWSTRTALLEARFMDGRGMGWDLMAWGFTSHGPMEGWTFKTVPALCQEAAVVMSCGGSFMVYDQPERTGRLVGWHMDELAGVAAFCRARQPFCQSTESVPQVAVLHSHRHLHRKGNLLFGLGDTAAPVVGALHLMLDLGLHVDLLQDETLVERLDRYPLVVVPEQEGLSVEMYRALSAYVGRGGRLLVVGRVATQPFDSLLGTEDSSREPAVPSAPVASKTSTKYLPDGRGTVATLGEWRSVTIPRDGGANRTEVVLPLFGRREGPIDGEDAGIAAGVRTVGEGRIAGIFGDLCTGYGSSHYPGLRCAVGRVVEALAPVGLMRAEGHRAIHVTLRRRADETFLHLVNLGTDRPQSPSSAYVEDVPDAGPVTVVLPMAEAPRAVRLEPGARPVDWIHGTDGIKIRIGTVGIHDILVVTTR